MRCDRFSAKMIFLVVSIGLLLVATVQSDRTPTHGVGAVYTMTNGAVNNGILVYRINPKGHLRWIRTVNTGGVGLNTTIFDPLASQGSLVVRSNYLFAINAGSNSVSMFTINPSDATKLTLVSVQPTYGAFPVSMTVNEQHVCALAVSPMAAIRCFSYNSSGLSIIPSFDRDLTPYVPQIVPPVVIPGQLNQIQFSADNRALIITVDGYNATIKGSLLFYPFNEDFTQLASTPIQQTLPHAVGPFSMVLVKSNGLLVTDVIANVVLTLKYSSEDGSISRNSFTPIDPKITGMLCWSIFSPTTGNYYVVAAFPAAIVELSVDITPTSTRAKIVRYYRFPKNTGGQDIAIANIAGIDHLYVIGLHPQVIRAYRLDGVGKAVANGVFRRPERNTTGLPKIVGMASYIQEV